MLIFGYKLGVSGYNKKVRILVFGQEKEGITPIIKKFGYVVVKADPEIIISYGGDGTLLRSEQIYPSIPKIPIRRSSTAIKCANHETEKILEKLKKGKLGSKKLLKLEAKFKKTSLTALNDVIIHHFLPNRAIRFKVLINDKEHVTYAIGDGLVIATPFGSSAYYASITKSTFESGFGIAFNNTTTEISHLVLSSEDVLTVGIIRGPATLSVDNNERIISLKNQDSVQIKKSPQVATILGLDSLSCSSCQKI